jgi:hypothetical protein
MFIRGNPNAAPILPALWRRQGLTGSGSIATGRSGGIADLTVVALGERSTTHCRRLCDESTLLQEHGGDAEMEILLDKAMALCMSLGAQCLIMLGSRLGGI